MKRLLYLLAVLLLLSGCGRDETDAQTDPPYQTAPPAVEAIPFVLDEDVFYFSNELEYGRLYSQRVDGTELTCVVNEACREVHQRGDTVYYIAGNDLCAYHIPTSESRVYLENVVSYLLDECYLVYFRFSEGDTYSWDMYWRDLETDTEGCALTVSPAGFDLYDGRVYFSDYDDSGTMALHSYDVRTGDVEILADGLRSCYGINATENGVYFESMDENYDFAWYHLPADGNVPEKISAKLESSCGLFHVSDDGFYCIAQYYADTARELIHRHNPDGMVTELYEAPGGGYLFASELPGGNWLIDQTDYVSWGPLNEYGNQEGFSVRTTYLLLDSEDRITSLHAPGVLGKMFPNGDFPVIDSSTARKPVTAALYNLFVKDYGYEGHEPLCSTTHGAWLNIADRKADIALLAAPTEEEQAYLNERGVEIEMKLYGGDGLVFIGNAANPVSDLTHEQIIGIYRGKITNWNELGGPDRPITVYYRDDQSGSQRLFEKLVFQGQSIPDFENLDFQRLDEMSTIVDTILEDPWAIGYSIMTYLDDVYAEENLQVFSANGVTPSPDTVQDATYPYHTQGYVVIRKDEPADSPARRLYNWFGCKVSDELLTDCGVSPLHEGVG